MIAIKGLCCAAYRRFSYFELTTSGRSATISHPSAIQAFCAATSTVLHGVWPSASTVTRGGMQMRGLSSLHSKLSKRPSGLTWQAAERIDKCYAVSRLIGSNARLLLQGHGRLTLSLGLVVSGDLKYL
ncbi:hypothetical protein IEQ34_008197 [Dendrobium chrysotoxum]|uniref:Uncharacterized protein n=1 Tax=Dendrobium chrysotoxum TaxID=161865 RepID=A0AAV7H6G1_DENCH|nr:hypothetical protein IEQ34_008197 [Dendrobium chrysotoxum]